MVRGGQTNNNNNKCKVTFLLTASDSALRDCSKEVREGPGYI